MIDAEKLKTLNVWSRSLNEVELLQASDFKINQDIYLRSVAVLEYIYRQLIIRGHAFEKHKALVKLFDLDEKGIDIEVNIQEVVSNGGIPYKLYIAIGGCKFTNFISTNISEPDDGFKLSEIVNEIMHVIEGNKKFNQEKEVKSDTSIKIINDWFGSTIEKYNIELDPDGEELVNFVLRMNTSPINVMKLLTKLSEL